MFRTTTTTLTSALRRPLATQFQIAQHIRIQPFSRTQARMGVTKDVIAEGNKTDYPKPGDTVSMHYVGTLTDGSKYACPNTSLPSIEALADMSSTTGSIPPGTAASRSRPRSVLEGSLRVRVDDPHPSARYLSHPYSHRPWRGPAVPQERGPLLCAIDG
jgi:hypothetical protein